MGLIEGWRKIAQLNLSATSPLDNNNARGFGMALASAAADLESACTPRPPKPEWFGTGPGQWDAWWVKGIGVLHTVEYAPMMHLISGYLENGEYVKVQADHVAVTPVSFTSENFPAPVGWNVVGG